MKVNLNVMMQVQENVKKYENPILLVLKIQISKTVSKNEQFLMKHTYKQNKLKNSLQVIVEHKSLIIAPLSKQDVSNSDIVFRQFDREMV